MKFVGGYDVPLEGKPSDEISSHSEPDVLYLPLFSRSFDYTALRVENGDSVTQGQILATDPVNFFTPLLAPLSGTVNLDKNERHITLENLSSAQKEPSGIEDVTSDNKREMMMRLGVWALLTRVDTGRMPDPEKDPEVLIVTIAQSEPFFPTPGALLAGKFDRFGAGLKQLRRVFDEAKIYLVVPDAVSDLAATISETIKDDSDWFTVLEVESRYPSENPALVARAQNFDLNGVWTLDTQAVLAIEQALNHGIPHLTRIVAVSGPVISNPAHFQVPTGYPLSSLLPGGRENVRMIDGGALTGRTVEASQLGLDSECISLTCLEENTNREVLAFAQVGLGKQSFSKTFASVFKPVFKEKYTTAVRGEARPCISCGYCEDVCPAKLMPHLIYRYLSKDRLEDACRVGLERCVECGLCSFVCLSKIEHLKVFREERRKCEDEKDSRE